MPDTENMPELENRDNFKEAVCIDAMRIYDSCSDKDISFYKSTPTYPVCRQRVAL